MTVTSKEQARQKQLHFSESMIVFEEVFEDELRGDLVARVATKAVNTTILSSHHPRTTKLPETPMSSPVALRNRT